MVTQIKQIKKEISDVLNYEIKLSRLSFLMFYNMLLFSLIYIYLFFIKSMSYILLYRFSNLSLNILVLTIFIGGITIFLLMNKLFEDFYKKSKNKNKSLY